MEIIAGVDEVGRGPLAGPVVAAAVILPDNHTIVGLRDSKKLSKIKREKLFPIIQDQALGIGIGEVDVKTIDKINIREATFKAMQIALGKLPIRPTKALIDGHPLKSQIIPNEGIIGGDDLVDSIKAASIIAEIFCFCIRVSGFLSDSAIDTKLISSPLYVPDLGAKPAQII